MHFDVLIQLTILKSPEKMILNWAIQKCVCVVCVCVCVLCVYVVCVCVEGGGSAPPKRGALYVLTVCQRLAKYIILVYRRVSKNGNFPRKLHVCEIERYGVCLWTEPPGKKIYWV